MIYLSKLIRNGFRAAGALLLTVSGFVHAQVTISNLPPARTPLQSGDAMIVNQVVSGQKTTRQSPLSNLAPFFPSLTSHYLLQAPDATLTQSRTLAGTANEIILTDGGALGNLTLSTPQPIAPASTPTFAGLTLTGPLSGTSASFTGAISAGSLSLTTPLPATSGGTGFGSYAIGDLLSASTTTALSKISDVAAGSYLRSGGVSTLPLWSTLTLPNAATTGDILFASGSNAIGNLADVTVGSYLRSGGATTAPLYSTVKIPNTDALGDLWVGSSTNNMTALAGNITTTKQFLTQTGTGAVSASPAWGIIAAGDLPGSFSGFANPSGLIGLTAVNGVATTATRSDATHAIDQTIAPTWTAKHTYTLAWTNGSLNFANAYSSANPATLFSETDQAAGEKNWVTSVNSKSWQLFTADDTGSLEKLAFNVQAGTSGAISAITVGNATDNNTFSFLGTGSIQRTASSTGTTNIYQQNSNTGTGAVTQFQQQNSTDSVYIGITSTGSTVAPWIGGPTTESAFVGNSGAVPLSIATNNSERLRIGSGGGISVHSGSGLNFLAYGELVNNGTTCTINAAIDNFGIASCTRVGAGQVTVNFSSTTGTTYVCTANAVGVVASAFISARSTTSVSTTLFNTAGSPVDAQFSVVCF